MPIATGKKRDYSSLSYSKVQAFSIETAGRFDLDAELELWFCGLCVVRLEFKGQVDILTIPSAGSSVSTSFERYRGGMGNLRVGMAFPDPPFNGMAGDDSRPAGLDVDLMTAVAEHLGDTVEFVGYDGADFDGIFDALGAGEYDCVAAGTTVTPERAARAAFAPPYLISGQSLAVDTARLPRVRSVDDLAGLTIGVQHGNTSQPIAERLVEEGRAARVRVYDYGDIATALDDLTTGGCDAFMKLAPVLTELVKHARGLEVVQKGLSTEDIAIAVAAGDQRLLSRITVAQAELEADGTLQGIRRKWLGNPYADQRLALH